MTTGKLQNTMYGLLYPSVLGAVIVTCAIRIATPGWSGDPYLVDRLSLGTLFLVFFCLSFANSSDAQSYKAAAFLLDLVEVALMFLGFWYLRLLAITTEEPETVYAYRTLLVLIPLQEIWRRVAVPERRWYLVELRIAVWMVLFVALLTRDSFSLVTPIASTAATALMVLYVRAPAWYARLRTRALRE
ncbi:MAG TPA: hypothetical protein VN649_22015 [Ramlibacter sp.]|nr:hypothetical protein [Ramlibacter sp.]